MLTGVSVGVNDRMGDAVDAGVGVGVGEDAGERVNEEEDDFGTGVQVGDNVDGRGGVPSKCLRDASRPIVRWSWPGADWAAVGVPCSSVLLGAQWV